MKAVNDTEKCKDWECRECDHTGLVVTHRQEATADCAMAEQVWCPECGSAFWSYHVAWVNDHVTSVGGEE